VMSVDGTGDRSMGQSDAQWWPQRDSLLLQTPEGINILTATDGFGAPVRRLFGAQLPATFSQDASEFIFSDEATPGHGPMDQPIRIGRLWRVPEQGNPKLLISEEEAFPIAAVWGSGSILYWDDPDFSASFRADGLQLFRVPATGGGDASPIDLTTLVNPDAMSLDAAGKRLAISAGKLRFEWQGKRIAVVDLRAGSASYVTDENVSAVWPAWSPDGSSIVYSAAPSGEAGGGEPARRALAKRRIFVVAVSGSGSPRQLTNDPNYRDEAPVFSADGQFIMFGRIDSASRMSLWMMKADGSGPSQIAGPLSAGEAGGEDPWFGYYGHIDWRRMWDARNVG